MKNKRALSVFEKHQLRIARVCVKNRMKTLNRPIRQEDLQPKGYPFVCDNCGSKPTPQQVVDHHGACEICGDTIVTYTVDCAEIFITLENGN